MSVNKYIKGPRLCCSVFAKLQKIYLKIQISNKLLKVNFIYFGSELTFHFAIHFKWFQWSTEIGIDCVVSRPVLAA